MEWEVSWSCGLALIVRPVYGGTEKFQSDPHWRDHILFYEYFRGDALRDSSGPRKSASKPRSSKGPKLREAGEMRKWPRPKYSVF